jgi:hypothetical protein
MILPAGLNLTKTECLYLIQHASHLTLFHFTTIATDAKAGTLGHSLDFLFITMVINSVPE